MILMSSDRRNGANRNAECPAAKQANQAPKDIAWFLWIFRSGLISVVERRSERTCWITDS
jgi:hypothetical protein